MYDSLIFKKLDIKKWVNCDSKKQETNHMSTKTFSVYCLETVSRLWHRLKNSGGDRGSLFLFRKHSWSPGRPRMLQLAQMGELYTQRYPTDTYKAHSRRNRPF